MTLFTFLARWWKAQPLAELARQVAQRSYALVRARVDHRAPAMSRAEARGYIRAQAMPVIRAEVDALLRRDPRIPGWARATLIAQASQRLVQSLLADVSRERSRRLERRRAA